LPHGKHRIKWIIADECDNETVCEYPFEVRDCQKPVVVCKPLSVNILQTKMVQLYASDFLEYAMDNITSQSNLKFALSTGMLAPKKFPRDSNGNAITIQTFNCQNLGANVIQLWAEDLVGNADYCQIVLLVQDNSSNCSGATAIGGVISTEKGDPVKDVGIVLSSPSNPAFPPVGLYSPSLTDITGKYSITNNSLPISSNVTMCPERDDNHLNGMTTLDLALINKHILNLEPLNSPYKIIGADANNSGTITTLDIVAFRRLILGIDNELPNNTSWRFVNKSYVFPSLINPFSKKFTECVTLGDIKNQVVSPDFIGIKMGDMNGTAQTNLSRAVADDRTDRVTYLRTRDRATLPGDVLRLLLSARKTWQHSSLRWRIRV